MKTRDLIERFVRDHFLIEPDDARFTPGVDLWEEGYVDSTGLVETIAYLEDTFDLRIPEPILMSTRLSTIDGMAEVIDELQGKEAHLGLG